MPNISFTAPNPKCRRAILEEYGFKYDRRIRENECFEITSLSRSTRWKMEQEGRFPPRCHFGRNSCAWLLSDVLWWVRNPPTVNNVNNPYKRRSLMSIDVFEGETDTDFEAMGIIDGVIK
ncbi:helix-turn-helix transcriptional regulator [Salmonella enterica subsp. enterica]